MDSMLLFAALFLPLFPLSIVFNDLFDRIRLQSLRAVMLLIWPQVGIALIYNANIEIPSWLVLWALATALIYAFRALVLREVSLWISFLATSTWATLWLVMDLNTSQIDMVLYALGYSVPLVILTLLCGELEKRFGAAYTGLYNGIAETLPRLSGVLVFAVLAIIATPLFPAFSAIIAAFINLTANSFTAALTLSLVWFIWGWASARLLQGLIIGEPKTQSVDDLCIGRTWLYALVLIALMIGGIYMVGNLS